MPNPPKKKRPADSGPPDNNQPATQTSVSDNLPVIFALLIIIGIGLMFTMMSLPAGNSAQTGPQNATVENGRQMINVTARGGYSPSVINAQADIPTTLRIKTENTFDCSASFTIPVLGISRMLPMSSNTDIEIPAQKAGTELIGTCAMGMYSFKIIFS